MKKFILRLFCLVLCVCCLFLSACENENENNNDIPDATQTKVDYAEHKVAGTIHYGYDQLQDSGMPFVTDSNTEYKIVYDQSNSAISEAATYIIANVRSATGATLTVETSPTWSSTAKYIVVGSKSLEQSAGVSITTKYNLGITGYEILTKDSSVFILANGEEGYHMGAVAFLQIVVGFKFINQDVVVYEKDGSYIPTMDIIERPDFDFRGSRTEGGHLNAISYGMGVKADQQMVISVPAVEGLPSQDIHNTFNYLPPETYYMDETSENYHPKFYSDGKAFEIRIYEDKWGIWPSQLCYTAHGDAEELALMQKIIAEQVIELALLESNAHKNIITVTQQDESYHCDCASCKEREEYFGQYSGVILQFINGVDDLVQAGLKKHAEETGTPVKELYILMFAYQDSRFPPTKHLDECKANPNVGIYYAASKTKYSATFYDEINTTERENIKGFSQLGDLYFYLYRYNSGYYFYPSNIFASTVENFRFCKENNGRFLTEECGYEQPFLTGFTSFKEYLTSRLAVNVNLDYKDLKKDFFTYNYGPGGVYMEQFFDELTSYMSYLRDQGDTNFQGCVVNENPNTRAYWPYQMLQRWLELCDKAFEAIEISKVEEPEMYQVYYDHILLESLFPRYALVDLYSGQYLADELQEMRRQIIVDAKALGYKVISSGGITIDKLAQNWGVA